MSGVTTTFVANPTQKAFIESRAEADLFSSRKGEGKSASLAWSAYYYSYHNPGADGVAIRDTFVNLQRTTMKEFFRWFPNGTYGNYTSSDRVWTWDTARTGLRGTLTFLGAESEQDAKRLASMNLAYALIDEPAPADGTSEGIDEFVFDTIMGQLRQPNMRWYAVKLATNNPDEEHWSYKRFVRPGTPYVEGAELLPLQESGYRCWQTREPENAHNLPPGYYNQMAKRWEKRPDLLRRFVLGKFGFQAKGKPLTPEWNDDIHLAAGLEPIPGAPLKLGWDGGLNPTCIITQVSPLGHWLVLDSFVGEEIGMLELITDVVKPRILERYPWVAKESGRLLTSILKHTGDPNLKAREQSSSANSALRVLVRELGGTWIPGPVSEADRLDPLREVMRKLRNGKGLMLVDRENAKEVWYALRGGWHRHISRGGVVGNIVKDKHSHPGDSIAYLAAHLFPLGKVVKPKQPVQSNVGNYFNTAPGARNSGPGTSLGMARHDIVVPHEARKIGIGGAKRLLPYKLG